MKKLLLALFLTATASAQVNVTSTGGTSPASYTTLKGAFDAINAGTHTGTIAIGLAGDTTETTTARINASGSGSASYTSVTITPTGGAARTISGTLGSIPLIDLSGADNVTFDGLNSGGNSLTLANLSTASTANTSTLRFIGGATGNTVTNCNVQGSALSAVSTAAGTIFFSTDTVSGNGNDNNTISNCNIGPSPAGLPSKAIYGLGSTTSMAVGNSGIVIQNNNIFDYFHPTSTSAGLATAGGCNGWSITNNRFYQTGTRSWTVGDMHRAIEILGSTANSGAQNFTVTGNIIGYASNTQTGTYALNGHQTGKFQAIHFNGIAGGTQSTILGNTIASISLTGAEYAGTGNLPVFGGIVVLSGNALVDGNTLGSQSAVGSLTVSSTTIGGAAEMTGIYYGGADNCTVSNNLLGGFSFSSTATSNGAVLFGIRVNASASNTATVTGNTIGGTIGGSLRNTSTSPATQVVGLVTFNPAAVFTGNTIQNLLASAGTGTGASASVIGILTSAASANHTVSQNVVRSLGNNGTGAHVVTGLQFNGATANVVARNFIYTLTCSSNNAATEVNGIRVAGGTTIYRNNMIVLGNTMNNSPGVGASDAGTSGLNGFNGTLGTDSFFHNSVYIGGTPSTGVGASYAFNGTQTTVSRSFRNNLLINARSGLGRHYAIKLNGTGPNPAGLTVDNNVYLASGTNGVFGYFNGADVANLIAWQAAVGQDVGSYQLNPQFVAPTANPPDLHISASSPTIVEGRGVDVGVTDDFDGQTRSTLTPVDLGADAGNFVASGDIVPPVVAFTPLANTSLTTARTLTATITDTESGVPTSGAGRPVLYWRINAGAYTAATGTFVSGNTYSFSFGAGAALGDTIRYYLVAQDGAATPNVVVSPSAGASGLTANPPAAATAPTTPASYTIVTGYAGTYTVGTGGTFASLTAAGGAFATLNAGVQTGDITLSITSDLTETGVNALNELAQESGGAFRVTIKPTGAARTVSGSSNTALIRFAGTDRVTIDGSLTGATAADVVGGEDALRQLTISNTSTGTSAAVMAVQIGANNGGANDFTLRNVKLLGQDYVTTAYGLAVGGNTVGTGGTNANVRIENVSVRRAIIGLSVAGASAASPNTGTVITKNHLAAGGVDRIRRVGVSCSNHNGLTVSLNDIGGLQTNESADAIGLAIGTELVDQTNTTAGGVRNATITRNRVDLVEGITSGFSAAGLTLAGDAGGPNVVSNNSIARVSSGATTTDLVAGIFVVGAAGSDSRLFYNSVSLSGDRGSIGSQRPGFAVAITGTNPTVQLRNNIFATTQIASGGGTNARSYSIGLASTTFTNLAANYNLFYSAGANAGFFRSGSLAAGAGTDYPTLAAWRTATGGDANSLFADPTFNANSLVPLPGSPAVGAGAPVAGITTDLLNVGRSATTPTIGAYETAADQTGPAISHTPLVNTISTANRALALTVTDPSGVPTTGTGRPVIYYRKNAGAYVAATASFVSGSSYSATLDYAPLGGVALGDTIQYYVVAQDSLANVASAPAGAAGFAANPPSASVPPAAPSSYRIVAPVAGNYNVGVGQTYTSLTDAGGFFEFVNNNALTGAVTVRIVSDLAETGAVALNQWQEIGGSNFTLTISPSGAARVISGATGPSTALLRLFGADRVVIDGSLAGGTDRSLTIANGTATSAAVWIASAAAGNGATGNTIRNCILGGSASVNALAGVVAGSGATLGSAAQAPNSDNTLQNNLFQRAATGVLIAGETTALDQNWLLSGNAFGSATAADKLTVRGLLLSGCGNFTVTGNLIAGVSSPTTANATGLEISGVINGGAITRNEIRDIRQTSAGAFGAHGLLLGASSTAAGVLVASNFISDVAAFGRTTVVSANDNGYGIMVNSGGGYRLVSNTVVLNSDQSVGGVQPVLNIASAVTTAGSLEIRNNILANTQTTGTRYAIYNGSTAGAAIFSTINHNDYFAPIVGFQGTARATLGAWQTATAQDAASLAVDPLFVSGTDFHLQSASPLSNAGTVVAGVTTDFDGAPRSALRPEIGADELPPSANAAGLTISAGTLSPAFATGTLAYTDVVANAVAGVTVTPTAADANATLEVRVNGGAYAAVASGAASANLPLNLGSNAIEVRLTGEFGAPQLTYTITTTRQAVLTAGTLSVSVNQGYGRAITQAQLLALATFSPGFSPTLTSADAASANGGGVGLLAGDSVTYTVPSPAFVGADSFQYLLTNSLGQTALGTINVTVIPPAFPPKAGTVTKSGGTFSASFTGAVPGLTYRLEYSPNLVTAFATVLNGGGSPITAVAGPTGNVSFSDPLSSGTKGFYRLVNP
ncbi:MAG: cadherin-like beta sandwich domain-containing protein [Verrucomicrobia bacterium]|nr:cadherin-like beta sandwich domain-containing protein [Verrucomicrobiota bacterium]